MTYKEEVVWKTYPEFPFIEVSQFGDVRTKDRYVKCKDGSKRLIKGRILKQHDNGHGYMQVEFSINNKTVNLYVHRIVAICFIPNPNNYPVVNHIDNDRTNNAVSNLEWCTKEYNEAYKKNFGTSQVEVSGRPVFAVNLETLEILWFESESEAARQLGVSVGSVNSVLQGKRIQIGGYWFTEDKNEITKEKLQEIKSNMHFLGSVIAINLSDFKVLHFRSQSETSCQLGIDNSKINTVVKGKQNKTQGWWFCYADENAVEKTRSKFGDEVAEKVEELMKGD